MPKRLTIALVVLVLIFSAGIGEILLLSDRFGTLLDEVDVVERDITNKTATVEQFDELLESWHDLHAVGQLIMPHVDVWDINLRLAEVRANLVTGDYAQAYTQLYVARELIESVPHLILPTIEHIL